MIKRLPAKEISTRLKIKSKTPAISVELTILITQFVDNRVPLYKLF